MNPNPVSRDTILHIPVSDIKPNPEQPRASFYRIEELSDSIKIHGIQNPVIVEPDGEGKYTLISGERRTRAAILAGLETIPAIICEGGDLAVLALIENVQREELSPIEEAKAYLKILNRGVSQEELSRQVGKTRSYIAQKIRLLSFAGSSIESAMIPGNIGSLSEGAARQLLRLKVLDDIATKTDPVYSSWLLCYADRIIWRPNYARSVREIGDLVDEYLTCLYLFKFQPIPSDGLIRGFIRGQIEKRKAGKDWTKVEFWQMSDVMRNRIGADYSRLTRNQEEELFSVVDRWVTKHCFDVGGLS
jgi:ParB/RepB/Spo0J family partition protein